MGDKSKFGIECIISRIFSQMQSDNMESRTSSRSNLSESSSWDFDTMCQNTAKLDEMMSSMKQGENVPCKVCKKRKDTLARREEIAWQREEIIHTREKELREWELMLEEKSRVLNEKEIKLKYDEGKVLQIEPVYNSEKNSRNSSLSDNGHCSLNSEQQRNENVKNEFLLEREKLLQEKEKIIFEKMENIVKKEQSIALKEQELNNQRIIFNKERELLSQKNHSLDLRELVVKKIEEAVERKLNSICEEKKSLDEKNILITQKENSLSTVAEYIQNKEQSLNERENVIIEKEKNIIQQISNWVKNDGTESPDEENKELHNKFDEIFDEKWKSIQERENTVVNSELILQEKWKEYSEGKELLKSEEESLQAIRDTFEKEKNILREWERLLEKREKVIEEKYELIDGNIDNKRSFLGVESVRTWPSPLDVQTETDVRMNRSSPFGAVGQMLNGDISLKLSDADENVDLSKDIPNSENREISGDELFQILEKEKESFHALLLKENANTSTDTGESGNSKKNHELTEPVKAFFNNKINVSSSIGMNVGEQVVCVPQINSKVTHLSFDVHEEKNKGETPQDDVLNTAIAFDSLNECSENQFIQDSSSVSPKRSIFLPMINKESDNKGNMELSGVEIDTSVKNMDKNDNKPSVMHETVSNNDSVAQNSIDSQNPQEGGSVSQDLISASPKSDKVNAENESNAKNKNDSGKTSEVFHTRVSPALSTSSSRSLTSPISGRGSPWLGRKRKPAREALLEAISKRNFLETVQLLDTNCMSLEVRNGDGRSAALLAVECGNIDLLERLMNKGADIKACDYKGYSALHIAVTENNSEMVLFLLKKGLNPLVTDINGNTAVKLASDLKFSTLCDVMNKYISKST
ncbi:NF-kappa-B inhibitor cactus [Gryllus bimaculatus]|nr:NF-kappa-B inhibitor cactus [Gryllus bimaculatus]